MCELAPLLAYIFCDEEFGAIACLCELQGKFEVRHWQSQWHRIQIFTVPPALPVILLDHRLSQRLTELFRKLAPLTGIWSDERFGIIACTCELQGEFEVRHWQSQWHRSVTVPPLNPASKTAKVEHAA